MNVKYHFDFAKFHVMKVSVDTKLSDFVEATKKMARSRQAAHNRGAKNTVLVMNDGQEQQLFAYILQNKLNGDRDVPVYGHLVVGDARGDAPKASAFTGGTVELRVYKTPGHGNSPPSYEITHCGARKNNTYVQGNWSSVTVTAS